MTRPSAKKLATKVDETMAELAEKLPEEPIHWKIKETSVDIELPDAVGMGGHTIIGGVHVEGVLQGLEFSANPKDINRLRLTLIAMPTKIRALAEVEIIDKQLITPEEADAQIRDYQNK